jgi:hypothetical protein
MVDPSRFEYAEGQSHASDIQKPNTHQTMPATPSTTPAVETSEIDDLRQQLTAADRKRRELLVALFLKHGGDTGPILDLLFAEVPTATLDRIETMLEEGGAS